MFDTPLSFFKKKKQNKNKIRKTKTPSTKKCIVTLIGIRIRLGLFFEVSTLPFTTLLSELNWWPAVISGELETARNCTGPNWNYNGGGVAFQLICWLAQLPQFWQCVVERYRSARYIDASTSASLFEYAAATVAIPLGNDIKGIDMISIRMYFLSVIEVHITLVILYSQRVGVTDWYVSNIIPYTEKGK